jgi:5'-3' exoribonuclease 1
MRRDPVTGASKKVYGTDEADVPIQLALWSAPTIDPRFQETEEQPVSVLFPHGAEVVATFGQLIGCKGKVIGPHQPADAGNARSSLRKAKAKQGASDAASSEAKGESVEESKGNDDAATAAGDKSAAADKKSRVVDVEFYVQPPEPPFGHAIAQSIQEEYFPARDVCRSLGISPSVLGKIVGSIFVEPGRYDLGLNLKRNGQYQLLGYVRKVSYENSAHGETSNGASASGAAGKGAWGHGDTVQVVGMIDNSKQADAAESVQWEYSAKAIALLFDYKTKFPMLFDNLERLPHQKKYPAHELVPPSAVLPPAEGKPLDPTAGAEVVKEWMKLQPFFAMPRTPLTTVSLSR